MSWFQLDPPAIADRARAAHAAVPSLAGSLGRGMIGFTLVSVAGFVPWAVCGHWIARHFGNPGVYAACALVFLVLAGLFLHRLIIGPGSLGRFYKLFTIAFAAYSIGWCAGWMALPGVYAGSIAGLLAGNVVMGWMLATAFDARASVVKIIATLFVLNSLGYFIGGVFEGVLIHDHALIAKLQWGVCYGLGFGAGIGLAFYFCQSQARALLMS